MALIKEVFGSKSTSIRLIHQILHQIYWKVLSNSTLEPFKLLKYINKEWDKLSKDKIFQSSKNILTQNKTGRHTSKNMEIYAGGGGD